MVGERLTDCIRKTDTVSRVGGDEFVVLLAETNNRDDAKGVAEKILKVVKDPLVIEDQTLTITTSIGIALFPQDGSSLDDLIQCADSAMYHVKQLGRDGYEFCVSHA
jgi:diguanylate cyclase (GGDEF)-like protein